MQGPILAKDIMVTKLVTLRPDMDVHAAAKLLVMQKISGAPVVDEHGNFVGVFSEKDMMTALIDAVYDEVPSVEVSAYMESAPHTISEDLDLLSIVKIFHANVFRRLPVLRDCKLVGQISRRDVLRAVNELIETARGRKTAMLSLSALKNSDEVSLD